MVFKRKKKEVAQAEPPPQTEGEWEQGVEDFNEQQLSNIGNAPAPTVAPVAIAPVAQPIAPPAKPTEQARIRSRVIRSDGVYEWIIESNYNLGEIGEMI
jgi:hypothetical protein|tara:strand:+ start:11722 stop:12018 length:297 start_codon:yes stop_codon:yes gene_type:complete